MNIEELKEFLSDKLEAFSRDVGRLSTEIASHGASLRSLELNTTTAISKLDGRLAEAEKDIQEIKRFSNVEKLEGTMQAANITLENRIRAVEESQKFKWTEYYKDKQAAIEARAKDEMSREKDLTDLKTEVKELIKISKLLTKILWAAAIAVIGFIAVAVTRWILMGGLAGILS